MDRRYLERPPRIQREQPQGQRLIPSPPEDNRQQPIWQAMVPVVTIIGYILVTATGRGTSITFLIPMALAVFISTGIAVYNAIDNWQERRRKKREYRRRLNEMRREVITSHEEQRQYYEYNYPAPTVIKHINGNDDQTRSGTRLWERRPLDSDFGRVRVGRGTLPSTVEFVLKQPENVDETDLMWQDAMRLEEEARFIENIPVTVPLFAMNFDEREADVPPNTYGIAGDPADVYPFIYSLLGQVAVLHAPTDAQIYILGLREQASAWRWAYDLPHCQINPAKQQHRLYFEDVERIVSPIDGVIIEWQVNTGDTVKPDTTIALVEDPKGQRIRVRGDHQAQISDLLVEKDEVVQAGQLIARTNLIALDAQYREEESDLDNDLMWLYGNQRKRAAAGVPIYWKEQIWSELDRRQRHKRDQSEDERNSPDQNPYMLIVVDMLHPTGVAQSWLNELESEAAVSLIDHAGAKLHASIIYLVPQRARVPGHCQAVLELVKAGREQVQYLYAETGLNSQRYIGEVDQPALTAEDLRQLVSTITQWQLRQSYGADVPNSVDLLELYGVNQITALNIARRWRNSVDPNRADWLKFPVGILAGQEARELYLFADADGVHGMIAGSTGSGKSELLMTMILSLAISYDPTVLNFVLIDFKGGATFDPFKKLPHVVDIVTNLGEGAVERMFTAITAELDRRQQINQTTSSRDIVRYRKRDYHRTRRDNYPHLLIIIDEFAQMIANNPEYRAQLDSITRLGRALGVSLILAAQRPSGVTDQMRANIKYRISLRVETKDDSNEILRMPDASRLPSIPGRGYLQVGTETLELIQVGYTGNPYSDKPDYDYQERYQEAPIIWEKDVLREDEEVTYDVLIRRMAQLTDNLHGPPSKWTWHKPWPNPLAPVIYLDRPDNIETSYLREEDTEFINTDPQATESFSLCPSLVAWQNDTISDWPGIDDWDIRAMKTVIGLIDDPSHASLYGLKIDLSISQHLILGTAGWGKSVFLQSLILSLACTHAPDELQIYILDMGNRSLQIFQGLPHVGAYIVSHEAESIARLLRFLDQTIEERQEILTNSQASNLYEYNQARQQRAERLPAYLVVVDNFAPFRETYEDHLELIANIAREGRANGLHLVVSADQTGSVGKLYNLLPERLTLKLSDSSQYTSIIGPGARMSEETPGRGLRLVGRTPLEFQVAMPLSLHEADPPEMTTQLKLLEVVEKLAKASTDQGYPEPQKIETLENIIPLNKLITQYRQLEKERGAAQLGVQALMGVDEITLEPKTIVLQDRPHFVILGPPSSGKTTALRTLILSLATRYSPDDVAFIFIDAQQNLITLGSDSRPLDDLPHMLAKAITTTAEIEALTTKLQQEFAQNRTERRDIFVIIEDYEDFNLLLPRNSQIKSQWGEMARRQGRNGLHFVVCGLGGSMSNDDFIRPVTSNRYGLAFDQSAAEGSPLYARVPRGYANTELPPGRGFLVQSNLVSMMQTATPVTKPQGSQRYQRWLDVIDKKFSQRATWTVPEDGPSATLEPGQEPAEADAAPAQQEPQPTLQESQEEQEDMATSDQETGLSDSTRQCLIEHILAAMGMTSDMAQNTGLDKMDDEGLIEMAKTHHIDLETCQ